MINSFSQGWGCPRWRRRESRPHVSTCVFVFRLEPGRSWGPSCGPRSWRSADSGPGEHLRAAIPSQKRGGSAESGQQGAAKPTVPAAASGRCGGPRARGAGGGGWLCSEAQPSERVSSNPLPRPSSSALEPLSPPSRFAARTVCPHSGCRLCGSKS